MSDDLWTVLHPFLPIHGNTHRFGGGRPRVPDRQGADAIFYVLRTGGPWPALDHTVLCAHSPAHDRSQAWGKAGVFLQRWQAGVSQCDARTGLDGDWLSMDGALTKAPLGGDATGPHPTDRGKSGVKRSVVTEGHGIPVGLAVDGANRHDRTMVRQTIEPLVGERPEPPPEHPQGLCLDKGDADQEVRDLLTVCGLTAPIRSRGAEAQDLKREAGTRARRWVVERSHSWMNRFRRMVIRWEKKPANSLGFLPFACALIAFRAAGLCG